MVFLSTSCQEENLSLQVVKTSIMNKEARRKNKGVLSQSDANMSQKPDRGRSKQRSPQKRDKSHARSKSKGKLTCLYCGKPGHFQKGYQYLKKDKGASNNVEPRKISKEKGFCSFASKRVQTLQMKSAPG